MSASGELDHMVRQPGAVPTRPPPRGIRAARSDFSVSISRALGMVVVTVHGALSPTSSGQLRRVLRDLIDLQGNRNLVIDLRDMTVGDGADLDLFVDASRDAWERGGHLTLSGPCGGTSEALARAGLIEALEADSGSQAPTARFTARVAPKTQKGGQ